MIEFFKKNQDNITKGGAVALLPIYAQDILKVGPEGFGVLRAAPALGAFITMFISAYVPLNKNAGMKLLFSIFAFVFSVFQPIFTFIL